MGEIEYEPTVFDTVVDPAAALPAEQDLRASILYASRGSQPWPECGRFLP